MKRFLRLIVPAVLPALSSLLIMTSTAAVQAAGDGWLTSLREAEAVAVREGKPILADFSTSWCGSCRELERKTFPHPYVRARMDKFVKVHVDGDDHPELVRSYGISGYPTLIAMSPGGKELNRTVGYVGAAELSSDLDRAMRKCGTLAPKSSSDEGEEREERPVKVAESRKPDKVSEPEKTVVAVPRERKSPDRTVSREVALVAGRREGP